MSERVRITDVSPRDGLQNEPGLVPTAEKLRLIELLSATGLDEIEIAGFVSPKWTPQLGDASEVAEGVRAFVDGVRSVLGAIPRSDDAGGLPVYSALVPNRRGFEAVEAVHEAGLPLKIALFTAASETFSERNTNTTIDGAIDRFRPIAPLAVERGLGIRFYVSCAVACPFEGATDPRVVADVVERLLALVGDEHRGDLDIDLADTIGAAHPDTIGALIRTMTDRFGREILGQATVHLHDTHGRATACVARALEMGVRSFDGSVAGLGGCPFAGTPAAPAPGNIATDALVGAVHDAGFTTGVDLGVLAEATAYARAIVARVRGGG